MNNVETFSVKQMLCSCSVHRESRKQVQILKEQLIRSCSLMTQLQKVSQHWEALKHPGAYVSSSESESDLYLVCFKVFHFSTNSFHCKEVLVCDWNKMKQKNFTADNLRNKYCRILSHENKVSGSFCESRYNLSISLLDQFPWTAGIKEWVEMNI